MIRKGPRSLRGALSTYAVASLVAVAGLLLAAFCFGPFLPDVGSTLAGVELPAGQGWEGGVLESRGRRLELFPGEVVEVPPGRYQLTLVSVDGSVERRELELEAGVRTRLEED